MSNFDGNPIKDMTSQFLPKANWDESAMLVFAKLSLLDYRLLINIPEDNNFGL